MGCLGWGRVPGSLAERPGIVRPPMAWALCWGARSEAGSRVLPGEAQGSRLKESGRGLSPPYPAPRPFIVQALTVLGTTPVLHPPRSRRREFKSTALPVEASPPCAGYPFAVSLSY